MARPKKTETIVEKLNTTEGVATDSNDLIRQLLAEIAELRSQINGNSGSDSKLDEKVEIKPEPEQFEDIDLDISPNKYIKVMSLCREKLNLSTEPYGRGKIFTFPKFGDTRQIMYSELVNIIHNSQKFIEEGRFYILNDAVIRKHGLLEIYENILPKDKIEKVLACNSKESLALYKATNEKQRNIIDQMLIAKMRDGEEVDLNIISAISKIAGFDLNQKAEEARQFLKVKTETENAS